MCAAHTHVMRRNACKGERRLCAERNACKACPHTRTCSRVLRGAANAQKAEPRERIWQQPRRRRRRLRHRRRQTRGGGLLQPWGSVVVQPSHVTRAPGGLHAREVWAASCKGPAAPSRTDGGRARGRARRARVGAATARRGVGMGCGGGGGRGQSPEAIAQHGLSHARDEIVKLARAGAHAGALVDAVGRVASWLGLLYTMGGGSKCGEEDV